MQKTTLSARFNSSPYPASDGTLNKSPKKSPKRITLNHGYPFKKTYLCAMKPLFKTDIALVILGSASLLSGVACHFAGHFYSQNTWQYVSLAHGIINIALLSAIAIHVKQHWGWFKGLIKKPSFTKKIAFFITLSFIAVTLSGIVVLLFSNTPNTHAGLVHFFIGLIFSLLVIVHVINRWKVFAKGIELTKK